MKEKYTSNARKVLQKAYRLADGFGQSYIGIITLLPGHTSERRPRNALSFFCTQLSLTFGIC